MSYNFETNKDSRNFTPANLAPSVFGMARVVEGITVHWWGDPNQNPTFDNVVNYLLANGSNTSAHFVATGTGRRVACIVAPGDVAHHSGSAWGNARTIGLELDPRARDEDYDVVAELVADIRSAYGDVLIYGHSNFISTACPGVWDLDRLDKLSYTKFSHATEWGKGGNKVQTPVPTPVIEPTPQPAPVTPVVYFKLLVAGKQVAAYTTEANAYKGYLEKGGTGKITLNGVDVTKKISDLFSTPSPTAGQPDSGLPVTEKNDYEELAKRVSWIEEFLTSLFNAFKRK